MILAFSPSLRRDVGDSASRSVHLLVAFDAASAERSA